MPNSPFLFRKAIFKDLPELIRLLADDDWGKDREVVGNTVAPSYEAAFETISKDPNHALMVVEHKGQIIGTCHLTFFTCLSFQGAKRMTVEEVRVESSHRKKGVGTWMMQEALRMGKEEGCKIAQLTSNKKRHEAHKFYEKLGFQASHEGMKLVLF